jgi:Lon protease-like protein
MVQKIPLFPLHTVLYPGMPITLHIFEERYREMIGRCLEQSAPFGVALIRSGGEVDPNDPFVRELRERAGVAAGDPPAAEAVPFPIGTTARISEAHRFDDGRYYLSAVGVRRFRMQYLVQHQPYLIASVAFMSEHVTAGVAEQAGELRSVYSRYWSAVERATGRKHEPDQPPEDPIELSYWMASRLHVDDVRKQRWLEADVTLRLRELTEALSTELALLPASRPSGSGGPWMWN